MSRLNILDHVYFVSSNEELCMVLSLANNECVQVGSLLGELTQTQDVNDALEDIIIVGDKIEVTSPVETFLIEAVHRTALAGSDASVSEITPNIESFINSKPSFEGLSNFVDASYKYIVDMLKKIWDYISDIVYKYFGAIPKLRSNLKTIKKKIENGDFSHTAWPTNTKFGVELFQLSRGDKIPDSGHSIIEGLTALETQMSFYFGSYLGQLSNIYDTVTDILNNFNEEKPELSVQAIYDAVLPLCETAIPESIATKDTVDSRFGNTYIELPPLPGNKTIYLKKKSKTNDNVLAKSDDLLTRNPALKDSKASLKKASLSNEMATMHTNEILNVCDLCLGMLDTVEEVFRGDVTEELRNKKDLLLKASEAITQRANNLETGNAKVIYYRTAIKFNTLLTNSYYQLVMGIANLALNVINASTQVCSKTIKL